MKLHRLLSAFIITITTINLSIMSNAIAKPPSKIDPNELAANVVFVKNPCVKLDKTKEHAADILMKLTNTGQQPHRIVAIFSPVAEQAQLRMTQHHHSLTHEINDIFIKPHASRNLTSNNTHIQLIGLKEALQKGQDIPVALIFNDGSWTTLFAKVS